LVKVMPARKKEQPLDLSKFPPGTVTESRTAYSEVKKYAPSVDELTAPRAVRPFFDSEDQNPHCPYCNAAKRWQARLDTYGIEGAKSADAARRELIRTLPKKDEQFRVQETKSDRRQVFFAWLDTLGRRLDLEEDSWLISAARAYLERLEPKTGWAEIFEGVRAIRRSNRIEEGWELDGRDSFSRLKSTTKCWWSNISSAAHTHMVD
jgi:hypothetical protein